jgi:hypothetical protein
VAALCFHYARQDGGRGLALMRMHPRVLIGDVEVRNPYYRPAGTRTAP